MPGAPDLTDVPEGYRGAVSEALGFAEVSDGHLALEVVDPERMRELNREHRGSDEPTDVLSFPIDEAGPSTGPRELGDVVICPEHCRDAVEAAVHGTLHLCGLDHERDSGEMLELQSQVMASLSMRGGAASQGQGLEGAEDVPSRGAEDGRSDGADGELQPPTRAGFVGLAGRPNVGKSTLVNLIVGAHVAIVSVRPQTTRRAIRGVVTGPDGVWQLVLVDLPGVQRPRDALTSRMQRRVEQELDAADVALMVVDGEAGVGPGDSFIAKAILASRRDLPLLCAVNKLDRLSRAQTLEALTAAAELEGVDEVFPISARTGAGVQELLDRMAELVPESPPLYPAEELTDQPRDVWLAELIREQVLMRTRDELPHSVEVSVRGVDRRDDGLLVIEAEIWPEAESQKGILIGSGGRKIREIGTAARSRLERELGEQVHLDLQVETRRRWRRDNRVLDRLGIE